MIISNNAKMPDYPDPREQQFFVKVYEDALAKIDEVGLSEFVPYFYEKTLESIYYLESEFNKIMYLEENSYYCNISQDSSDLSIALTAFYTEEALTKYDRTHADPSFCLGYRIEFQKIIDTNKFISLEGPFWVHQIVPNLVVQIGDTYLVEKLKNHLHKLIEVATSQDLIEKYAAQLIEVAGYKKR